MPFSVVLSPDAINDIDIAVEYYNRLSEGLGFEFTDTIDAYLKKIANFPTASAIRYDNIRVKPIDTFPFTIHFIIADTSTVVILRIFNTYQKPIA
ncbi:MAG TPA: type II toxin-antitoxin system RelE/ParE family toxin [Niastella sp.]